MKAITALLALATVVSAHYTFPKTIYGGTTSADWQYVRDWTGSYTYNPVTDVNSVDIRCNVDGTKNFAPSTLSVAAGQNIGFTANPNIYHPGPLLAYLAKVPSGKTAANWDGSGSVWFKIYQDKPVVGAYALDWPTNGTFITASKPELPLWAKPFIPPTTSLL